MRTLAATGKRRVGATMPPAGDGVQPAAWDRPAGGPAGVDVPNAPYRFTPSPRMNWQTPLPRITTIRFFGASPATVASAP